MHKFAYVREKFSVTQLFQVPNTRTWPASPVRRQFFWMWFRPRPRSADLRCLRSRWPSRDHIVTARIERPAGLERGQIGDARGRRSGPHQWCRTGRRPGPCRRPAEIGVGIEQIVGDVLKIFPSAARRSSSSDGGGIGQRGGVVDVLARDVLTRQQRFAPAEARRQRDLGVAFGQERIADHIVERAVEVAARY